MKKVLLLLIAVSLYSCSGDDSNDGSSPDSYLSPPAWIQGTWKNDTGGFAFKPNDFCSVSGNTEICIDAQLQASSAVTSVSASEPVKSESEYKFSYTLNSHTQAYHFRKVSATMIELVNPNPQLPNATFTKQ